MFQCKYCGKAFASHAAHDSHVRRTHAQEKANSCKECGQQFGHIFDLKLHMRVHEGRLIVRVTPFFGVFSSSRRNTLYIG